MLYSHAGIFSEMAQASPTKHSLSRCSYDLYVSNPEMQKGWYFEPHSFSCHCMPFNLSFLYSSICPTHVFKIEFSFYGSDLISISLDEKLDPIILKCDGHLLNCARWWWGLSSVWLEGSIILSVLGHSQRLVWMTFYCQMAFRPMTRFESNVC